MIYIIDLPSLTILSIGDGSFGNSTIFQLSNLNSLQSLNIGNEMFNLVSTFKIDGLISLTLLSIGSNSFTSVKNGFGNDSGKSFHILNCAKLESMVNIVSVIMVANLNYRIYLNYNR